MKNPIDLAEFLKNPEESYGDLLPTASDGASLTA
jgi:hypothetical protein